MPGNLDDLAVDRDGPGRLVEFPGADEPWLRECRRCGNRVTPRLANISRGQGGCIACGLKASAAARLGDEEQAA